LLAYSKKRNATSYDAAGSIARQDLRDAIKVASELPAIAFFVCAFLQERRS
jgi:hypothetical protein